METASVLPYVRRHRRCRTASFGGCTLHHRAVPARLARCCVCASQLASFYVPCYGTLLLSVLLTVMWADVGRSLHVCRCATGTDERVLIWFSVDLGHSFWVLLELVLGAA